MEHCETFRMKKAYLIVGCSSSKGRGGGGNAEPTVSVLLLVGELGVWLRLFLNISLLLLGSLIISPPSLRFNDYPKFVAVWWRWGWDVGDVDGGWGGGRVSVEYVLLRGTTHMKTRGNKYSGSTS